MKYSIFLLLFIVSVYSCNKSQAVPDQIVPGKEYVGKWNWINSVGGFGGETLKPGKDTIISIWLNKDSAYTCFVNGVRLTEGHFNTEKLTYWDSALVVHFDHYLRVGNLNMRQDLGLEQISKDTLLLYDAFISDGFGHFFVRGK